MRFRQMVILAFCAAILLVVSAALYHYRILIPTSRYIVAVTENGVQVECELRRPLFVSDLFYLFSATTDDRRDYRCIGFDTDRNVAFTPIAVRDGLFGARYVHHDQMNGVSLLSPKIEDSQWRIDFAPSGNVTLTNRLLKIALSR